MTRKIRIILWGMGKDYNSHLSLLKRYEQAEEIEVVGVTAKDVPNYRYIDAWPVIRAEQILELDFDYVMIFATRYVKEIIHNIVGMGIQRNRILDGKIVDIPYFEWTEYLEIFNSELSVISNNCAGGILCNSLGIECKSPFKNLWVDPLALCNKYQDLPRLLKEEPIFDSWECDTHSHQKCPVGRIRDFKIHFNHSSDWESALQKWNERLVKINYDNLFLLIYAENEETVNSFVGLINQGYKGACLVPDELRHLANRDEIYSLKLLPGQSEFYEIVNASVSTGRNGFCYELLSMLGGKKRMRLT